MERLSELRPKAAKKPTKNRYLHSPNHLLADELSIKLRDQKHFGFYLKMAELYDHDWLRKLSGEVMEGSNVKTPGKLFAYLIKKRNQQQWIYLLPNYQQRSCVSQWRT